MRNSILNKMAYNDFLLKVLERFYQRFKFFEKSRILIKNGDNGKVFHFFLILNSKRVLETFLRMSYE